MILQKLSFYMNDMKQAFGKDTDIADSQTDANYNIACVIRNKCW